jgi:hypothetical protein
MREFNWYRDWYRQCRVFGRVIYNPRSNCIYSVLFFLKSLRRLVKDSNSKRNLHVFKIFRPRSQTIPMLTPFVNSCFKIPYRDIKFDYILLFHTIISLYLLIFIYMVIAKLQHFTILPLIFQTFLDYVEAAFVTSHSLLSIFSLIY